MMQLSSEQKHSGTAPAAQTRGGSTRYLFMDVLRALAFSVIIYYHFFKDLVIRGIADITDPDMVLSIGDVHLVKLAVGMFFMISGVGLAVKYSRAQSKAGPGKPDGVCSCRRFPGLWDAKTLRSYYLGRFRQIFIPYYIVYIIYALVKIKKTNGAIFSDTPRWRIVLTALGLDNYIAALGYRTFSLDIGEWFLSILIVMYVLFPLIYVLLKRHPRAAMIIWSVYFIAISYASAQLRALLPASIAARLVNILWHMDPFVKICEFVLGVFLGIYLEDIKRYPQLIAVGLLAFTPIHPAIINTALVLAIFLIGLHVETYLAKKQKADISRFFTSAISAIAGLSYYIYLVHHAIIYSVDDCLAGKVILDNKLILALFIAELAAMVLTAIVLRKVSEMIRKHI